MMKPTTLKNPEGEEVHGAVGFVLGYPVVPDLQFDPEGMALIKSDPEEEPNCWHCTPEAAERLIQAGHLTSTP